MKDQKIFIIWIVVITVILTGFYALSGSLSNDKGDSINSVSSSPNIDKSVEDEIISNDPFAPVNHSSDLDEQQLESEFKDGIIPIKDINTEMVGNSVKIVGTIIDITAHKNGHLFLLVSGEESDVISVPIFADKDISHEQFEIGKTFYFSGKVGEYNDEMEIVPETQNDIKVFEVMNNDNKLVTEANVGKEVIVEGELVNKYNHPEGHVFMTLKLTDTDKEITVPIFNTMKYDAAEFIVNSLLSIEGKVDVYNNELEVIPNNEGGIIILDSKEENKAELVDISEITNDYRGRMVVVRGYVSELDERNEHLYFKLSMDGSTINAVLFRADGDEIIGRKVKVGQAAETDFPIKILGTVDIYEDELEIIIDKVYNEY